ncbi:MAG: hypothetical protein ACREVI_12945 [Steroidobacteraceae bacterium]
MRMAPAAQAHANIELPQWNEFVGLGELRPKIFGSIRIDYTPNRTFRHRSQRFEIGLDAGFIDITDQASLDLGFTFFPQHAAVVRDVSEFSYHENREKPFEVIVRRAALVPAELGGGLYREWGRMTPREAPFDGRPYLDEEYPRLRIVFGLPAVAGAAAVEPERLYEVGLTANGYMSREGAHELQQELLAAFKLLE